MMNNRFFASGLIFLLMGFVILLGAGQALAKSEVVLAIGGQPETLDPYNTNTTLTTAVTKSFYEGLFQFDKDLKVVPVLALSYTLTDDGLTYVFKLRPNVKFHDGTDFNATAVKVNIDRVLDRSNALARYNQFSRIDRVEVVDPLTVRFVLKEPFAPFINSLAHSSAAMISPKALAEQKGNIAFNPVGTGQFRFLEWRQTDHIKGIRFEGYWRQGHPGVERITWKPVLENSTRTAMLQTREADFAFPLPLEQIEAIRRVSSLTVVTRPSIVVRYMSFNMLQKPFDDVRVRQAINHAINREAMSRVVYNNYSFPAEGFIPQGIPYALKKPLPQYDPAKARALLTEAGYPNGFETVLWGGYANTDAVKALQFMQQQLAQVGIKVSIQALEIGQRVELVQSAQDPQKAGVRMYFAGWSSSTGEADWALRPLFSTEAWPPGLNNTAYYSNPVFDEAIHQALRATTEQEKEENYLKAQEQLYLDLPWSPLVTDQIVYAHDKELTGVYVMPDGSIDITDISYPK